MPKRAFKIRTMLLISSALLVGFSLLIAVAMSLTTRRAEQYLAQGNQSENIIAGAYTLKVLAQEYISYHEDRPRQQWFLQMDRMQQAITDPVMQAAPAGGHVSSLTSQTGEIKRSFEQLVALKEGGKDEPALERQLVGDVLVQTQRLISEVDVLAKETFDQRSSTRIASDRLVFMLLLALALLANGIILVLYRRIIGSIGRLQKGIQIIGRGNLGYRLSGDDGSEIGQLSAAFNLMTEKLKRSYDTLEEKVEERTRDLELLSRKNEILLKSIGDGVFVIDADWNITFWNDAAGEISGWRPDEAIGKPFKDVVRFVRASDKSENIEFIREAMTHGESRMMENSTLMIARDGREVPVGDSVAPVFDGDDPSKVTGAIVVFRDVSAEHDLKDKEAQITKLKDDFLFRTIHDLRSPTNSIRLALQAHAEEEAKVSTPYLEKTSGMIRDASDRMGKLIDDLLEIAKGENAEMMLRVEPVDLTAVSQSVIEETQSYMASREVRLEHSAASNLPHVVADADALKEVFDNLVNNAIKYNKKGGLIRVSHEVEGAFVKTSIHDSGIGIPKESVGKLFTPYFRAAGRDIPGTGLGLYIVKRLIEKMNGQITVTSMAGEGTTFTFILPAEQPQKNSVPK